MSCWIAQFAQTHYINTHDAFSIHDLTIQPFPVPHDAREPCQFVFQDGQYKIGHLTDVGSMTPIITQTLQQLDALMLECNYDSQMLEEGEYPVVLKKRVSGRYGHFSNFQASVLLKELNLSRMQHLVGMHVSEKNNLPCLSCFMYGSRLQRKLDTACKSTRWYRIGRSPINYLNFFKRGYWV